MSVERTDLLVIGAGPCGLAVGVAAKHAGVSCVLHTTCPSFMSNAKMASDEVVWGSVYWFPVAA